MKCPRCQADNRAGVKFCESCGTGLDLACPRCGSPVAADKKYCGACGSALTPSASAYTSPHVYTPAYLAERILRSRSHMEGERKQVTVLFADIRGSLELLADRDPEEAGRILDPVLVRMMDAVHRYEGTVNQVMGDGIMALFGAPLAREDHAVRACYAALRMQQTVGALSAELRQSYGLNVQIRIGINSGEVVVRSVGSDLRMDYTAVGQTTHLAGRMEQLADAGKTFLTGHTLRLAEGFVAVKSLGLVPIRGLADRVPIYELTGPGPMQSRLQIAAARGLTPFIGRQSELAKLRAALDKAAGGAGQVVALVGEPGVGKSRLVHEFSMDCLASDWRLLTASATALERTTAYLPIVGLLCGYFDIQYGDDKARIREKVTASLLNLDESLLSSLPALLTMLDVPLEDAAWHNLEPRQRRSRALEALRTLFLRESVRRPLCLVIEDLHWIDPEAHAVLDSLVQVLANARILLLVTSRPEGKHPWTGKSFYSQVVVHPLTESMAAEMLRQLIGESQGATALSADLISRTEGNPLFLEESVRHLAETGVLTGERGSYRLTRTNAMWEVPATVQALLAARIDRLPQADKRVLQCAAVVGKNVPVILLEAIAELEPDDLRRSLSYLQTAGFLYETTLFPVHEYAFRHTLTLEVSYGALLHDRRRALHAQILDALETSFPERTAELVERLAYHAFRGEVWAKAVQYLRLAGERAAARSLNREAIARFRDALTALEHLGESREVAEQAIDIRVEIRHCLLPLGAQEEIAENLRAAAALALQIEDQRRLGWVHSYLAHHWWYTGLPKSAIDSGQTALSIAAAVRDPVLRALTDFHLGQAYHALGDYRGANRFLEQTLASPEADILAERFGILYAVRSNSWLAWSHAELGNFDDGRAHGEAGVRIAEAADQPFSLITAYVGLAVVCLRKGEVARAATLLERGLALARARDLPVLFPTVGSRLGSAYVLLGRLSEASLLLEEASAQAAAMSRLSGHSLRLTQLAEAYLALGRIDAALSTGERALKLSLQHQEGGYQAWALRLLADAMATQKTEQSLAVASTTFMESLALAESLGMRPLVAHCHIGLSKVHRQVNEEESARAHRASGMSLYAALNMRFWMEKAESEIREEA